MTMVRMFHRNSVPDATVPQIHSILGYRRPTLVNMDYPDWTILQANATSKNRARTNEFQEENQNRPKQKSQNENCTENEAITITRQHTISIFTLHTHTMHQTLIWITHKSEFPNLLFFTFYLCLCLTQWLSLLSHWKHWIACGSSLLKIASESPTCARF